MNSLFSSRRVSQGANGDFVADSDLALSVTEV